MAIVLFNTANCSANDNDVTSNCKRLKLNSCFSERVKTLLIKRPYTTRCIKYVVEETKMLSNYPIWA